MINLSKKPIRIVDNSGTIRYTLNGKYYRENGPTVIYPDGTQVWCKNGKWHREDGPAIIYPDGRQDWYINDKFIRTN